MAKGKDSFLLYCDLIDIMPSLTMNDRGELFTYILQYVNDNDPEEPASCSEALRLSIMMVRGKLKRDLKKWNEKIEKKSFAGRKSGEVRRAKKLSNSVDVAPKEAKQVEVELKPLEKPKPKDKPKVYPLKVVNGCKSLLKYFPENCHPKNLLSWVKVYDELLRIDKLTHERIETIVKKTREDSFWAKNFLSLVKLRNLNSDKVKYWVVYEEKIKLESKKTNQNGQQVSNKKSTFERYTEARSTRRG